METILLEWNVNLKIKSLQKKSLTYMITPRKTEFHPQSLMLKRMKRSSLSFDLCYKQEKLW